MTLQLTGPGRVRLVGAGRVAGASAGDSTPPVVVVPPVGNGTFTGLALRQPMPIHPKTQYQVTIGRLVASGGVGPFVYSGTSSNSRYRINAATGIIDIPSFGDITLSADTITATVTDALGATITGTFPVAKTASAAPYLFVEHLGFEDANVAGNPFFQERLRILAYGGDHTGADTVAYIVSGPGAGAFGVQYAMLTALYQGSDSVPVPPGSYPIHMTATSATETLTRDEVLVIGPVPDINAFVFVPSVVSTSQPPGTIIGRVLATTPTNGRVVSIGGPDGHYLAVVPDTGVVSINVTPPLRDLVVDITIVDRLATRTERHTVPVVQGVLLPPTNMTLAVTPGLDNYAIGQVIGTPVVTGIPGTHAWSLVFEEHYVSNYLPTALFEIDPATGRVTSGFKLSNWTYALTITCTDGVNTCSQTFAVPVAWVANARTIHVGEGQAAANPDGYGFEHLTNVLALFKLPDLGVYAGATVIVHPNANPSYYAEDNGNNLNGTSFGYFGQIQYGWNGPVHIKGATPNGVRPLLGGTIGAAFGGADPGGKGFFNLANGDQILEGLDIRSCCEANGTGGTSISAIRKNADVTGDLTVINCNLQDCPDGILSGKGPYRVFISHTTMSNTGNVFHPSTHGSYIGACVELVYTDNISYNTTSGHNLKTRARKATIQRSRFLDGERGSASCQIEMPQGGDYLIEDCFLHKGGQIQNAGMAKFGAEVIYYPEDKRLNNLTIRRSTFAATMPPLGYAGEPIGVWHYSQLSLVDGSASVVTLDDNNFFLGGAAIKYKDESGVGVLHESGTTLLTQAPALDFADPGTASPPAPRAGFWHDIQDGGTGGGEYPGFDHVQIDPGLDDIRIPVTTAIGTVIFTCTRLWRGLLEAVLTERSARQSVRTGIGLEHQPGRAGVSVQFAVGVGAGRALRHRPIDRRFPSGGRADRRLGFRQGQGAVTRWRHLRHAPAVHRRAALACVESDTNAPTSYDPSSEPAGAGRPALRLSLLHFGGSVAAAPASPSAVALAVGFGRDPAQEHGRADNAEPDQPKHEQYPF